MQKNVYIYNEDLELIAQPFVDTIENFNSNPELYFPNWAVNMYVSETKFEYPILDGDTLRDMTKEEKIIQLGMEELLEDGEYIEDGQIIKVEYDENLGYLKRTWNKETHVWYEGATEEEITNHMGTLVTKLLYDVMKIGCDVIIDEKKHQQSLSDEKRKALTERISGFNLAQELGRPIEQVAWPFKDDGTDTVVMTTEQFKQMALACLDFGEKCYIAAELLKAKRKVKSTIEDFYEELKNVKSISLLNL